jgi:small subunit ribosomal protein S28e
MSSKKIIEKKAEEGAGVKVEVSGEATPAQILEIVGSMGTREGGKQARVKLLAGREAGKIMRRNILGPFRIGDIVMLKETEIEASPLKGRKR